MSFCHCPFCKARNSKRRNPEDIDILEFLDRQACIASKFPNISAEKMGKKLLKAYKNLGSWDAAEEHVTNSLQAQNEVLEAGQNIVCVKAYPGDIVSGIAVPRFIYRGHNQERYELQGFSATSSLTRAAWYGSYIDVYEFIGGNVGLGYSVTEKIREDPRDTSWTYKVSKDKCKQYAYCDIFLAGSLIPSLPLGIAYPYDHPNHWGDISVCNPDCLQHIETVRSNEIGLDFDFSDLELCTMCNGFTLCEKTEAHVDCEVCGYDRTRCPYCLKLSKCECQGKDYCRCG